MKKKKVIINLNEWDYKCGDGCCYMYGTELSVNGVKSENEYHGDNVENAIEYVLNQLGYDVEINTTNEM